MKRRPMTNLPLALFFIVIGCLECVHGTTDKGSLFLWCRFGYYSAEWDKHNPLGPALLMGEGGEALTVIDPEETWMFHITPDDTGNLCICRISHYGTNFL